jgi:hypothetical protein
LLKDARKITEHLQEASRHHENGDLQAIADVVGLIHYPLGQVSDEVNGLLGYLAAQGIRPSRGDR